MLPPAPKESAVRIGPVLGRVAIRDRAITPVLGIHPLVAAALRSKVTFAEKGAVLGERCG